MRRRTEADENLPTTEASEIPALIRVLLAHTIHHQSDHHQSHDSCSVEQ
jgi:hypothetical protein